MPPRSLASTASPPTIINPPQLLERSSAFQRPVGLTAERSSFIQQIENMLRDYARQNFNHLDLGLALPPETIFGDRTCRHYGLDDIGLTPGAPGTASTARQWIQVHFEGMHHDTPFLHLPLINQLCDGLFGLPNQPRQPRAADLHPDELALLFAVMALGSFRSETWDPVLGKYRQLSQDTLGFDGPAVLIGDVPLALFELANEQLDNLASPSELAVQALYLLHTFVSNTMMNRRSRDYVARAVMMAHEVGLNRVIPWQLQIVDGGSLKRRAILYLYVYFSDIYLSALDNQTPLIKSTDFEPQIFDRIVFSGAQSGSPTIAGSTNTGLKAFVDLVVVQGKILESLHGSATTQMHVDYILTLDRNLDVLRTKLGSRTFGVEHDRVSKDERTQTAGRLLWQIHYNWCAPLPPATDHRCRIAVRAPDIEDPLLGHSSLAICTRASSSLLILYRQVCTAGLLNLPWTQLRRIVTAMHLVFLAFFRGEVPVEEVEEAIDHTLLLLKILGTRWKAATSSATAIKQLASASGLRYRDTPYQVPGGMRLPDTLPADPSADSDQRLPGVEGSILDGFLQSAETHGSRPAHLQRIWHQGPQILLGR
ncbi:hypothetical protein JCM24511_06138 [Saitozyma sp. JCM 24511]|nr:hypothetical protein JCM24511_06138 [Saitozyma sp. JCM 24511]